jgi:hypothetical protein
MIKRKSHKKTFLKQFSFVCFATFMSQNLPARGRKTEKQRDGKIVYDNESITNSICKFYNKLYGGKNKPDKHTENYMENVNCVKVNESEKQLYDATPT